MHQTFKILVFSLPDEGYCAWVDIHTVGAARIVTFLDINLQFLAYNSTYYVISALELTIILDTIHIILHSLSV